MTTTPTIWLNEFITNLVQLGNQSNPQVISLSNGNFLVVWEDDNDTVADGTGTDIVGVIFDPLGNAISSSLYLNFPFGYSREESNPVLAPHTDGGFIVIYDFPNAAGTETPILLGIYDDTGTRTAQNFVISDTSTSGFTYSNTSVASLDDGSFFVTMIRDDGTSQDLVGKKISADGLTVGPLVELRVDGFSNGSNLEDIAAPQTVALTNGTFVTAYSENDNNGGVNERTIEVRISAADGSNTTLINNVSTPDGVPDSEPAIAALSDGRFVVIWQEGGNHNGRIFNSDGTESVAQFTVSSNAAIFFEDAQVIGLEDGSFFVTLYDSTVGRLFGIRYNDNIVEGGSTIISTDASGIGGAITSHSIDLTGDGRILVTWNNGEIYTEILDPRDAGTITVEAGDAVTTGRQEGTTIIGTTDDDVIFGMGGNDTINGGLGSDTMDGGTGDDVLRFDASGHVEEGEVINGGADTDVIQVGGLNGDIFNFRGTDIQNIEGVEFDTAADNINRSVQFDGGDVQSGLASDLLIDGFNGGTDNIETIEIHMDAAGAIDISGWTFQEFGSTAATSVDGMETISIFGTSENDIITGSSENDIIFGGFGFDIMAGGDGDDVLNRGFGTGSMDGGAGNDTASFEGDIRDIVASLETSSIATSSTRINAENVSTTSAVLTAALAGNIYINVHSAANAGGEIRGQFGSVESDTTDGSGVRTVIFDPISLSGGLEVPAVITDAVGIASVVFTDDNGTVTYSIVNHMANIDFGDIAGSHLHEAAAGANGDVVSDILNAPGASLGLSSTSGGTPMTNFENLTGGLGDDTLTGNSGDNIIDGGDGDDTIIGGAGEDTLDGGAGIDTVSFEGDLRDITASLSGSTASAAVTVIEAQNVGTTEAVLTAALAGDIYINVHSAANAGGELRGQIGSVESDTTDGSGVRTVVFDPVLLSGSQEVSPVMTDASGTASVVFTDDNGTVTYTIVNTMINIAPGDITGSHLHEAAAGLNGGVVSNILAAPGATNTAEVETDSLANFQNLTGGDGDDTLTGNGSSNVIIGGDGNDTIIGGDGNDTLDGGEGNDTFIHVGIEVLDNIVGGAGVDTLDMSATTYDQVTIDLQAGTYNDTFDFVTVTETENAIGTLINTNTISGTSEANELTGGNLGDVLDGRGGIDHLMGGGGDDVLTGGAGADVLDGGADIDTVSYAGSAARVIANLFTGTGGGVGSEASGDTYTDIEGIIGSDHNDILVGRDGMSSDTLRGGEGNDSLRANGGNDFVFGEGGNDLIFAGFGSDTIDGGDGIDTLMLTNASAGAIIRLDLGTGSLNVAAGDTYTDIENIAGSAFRDLLYGDDGVNFLDGRGGNDLLIGNGGADTLDGGDGFDTVSYANSASGITASLASGTGPGSDIIREVEHLVGSAFGDFLYGDDSVNLLEGGAGNDLLVGNGGADTLNGGDGFDTVSYATSASGITASLFLGTGPGGDIIQNVEHLVGSNFNDLLVGNDGADETLDGGGGADSLRGNGGNDILNGGGGNDILFSGFGNDAHDGGAGFDTINYSQASAGVIVRLDLGTGSLGHAAGDTYANIENITGSSAFRDLLYGNDIGNIIDGRGGNDLLIGNGGSDTLIGGNGFDKLDGGTGFDVLTGGAGNDTFVFEAGYQADRVTDFTIGEDQVDLTSFGFTTYSQVSSLMYTDGADTVLTFGGGDAIRLVGISLGDLSASDFMITAPPGNAPADPANIDGDETDETLDGTPDADVIKGFGGNDIINGLGGDDTLDGGAGNDVIDGGDGDDTASYASATAGVTVNLQDGTAQDTGGAGVDTLTNITHIIGSAFNDTLRGISNSSDVFGEGGDDRLVFGSGDGFPTFHGGDGSDTFDSSSFLSVPMYINLVDEGYHWGSSSPGTYQDRIYDIENYNGTGDVDVVVGNDVANILNTNDGDDELYGAGGNDVLEGGAGADILDGGADFDIATYAGAAAGVTANLFSGVGNRSDAAGDTYTGIEALRGSAFDDVLVGRGDAGDTLYGGQGNDSLRANGGDDFVFGEGGNDLIFAGFGNDTIDGGDGIDTLMLTNASAGAIIRLDLGTGSLNVADGDTYTNVENVAGSAFRDLLYGDDNNNFLDGRGGDDLLIGNGGADVLDGGDGFDTASYANSGTAVTVSLFLGTGPGSDIIRNVEHVVGSNFGDLLVGNDGVDETLDGGIGVDSLRGNGGNDTLNGGDGNDLLFSGFGNDTHDGGAGFDTVTYAEASAGVIVRLDLGTGSLGHAEGDTYIRVENATGSSAFRDLLYGNGGANVLDGRGGNDLLVGKDGSDTLIGGNGFDTLDGGTGFDILTGGAGNDSFVFEAGYQADRITDFTIGEDQVDLSSFGYTMYSQVSSLMYTDGADTVLTFGGGDAIRLVGISLGDLSASDFMITPTPGNAPAAKSDFAADVDSFDFADDFTQQDQSVAFMQQALIAEFTASQAMNVPLYKTNDYGVLEIFTPDDIGYDIWDAVI